MGPGTNGKTVWVEPQPLASISICYFLHASNGWTHVYLASKVTNCVKCNKLYRYNATSRYVHAHPVVSGCGLSTACSGSQLLTQPSHAPCDTPRRPPDAPISKTQIDEKVNDEPEDTMSASHCIWHSAHVPCRVRVRGMAMVSAIGRLGRAGRQPDGARRRWQGCKQLDSTLQCAYYQAQHTTWLQKQSPRVSLAHPCVF